MPIPFDFNIRSGGFPMTHRNNLSANGKWISAIAALLCLCMLFASCHTADSGIDAGDVTPENSMSQQEEPETDEPETADPAGDDPKTEAVDGDAAADETDTAGETAPAPEPAAAPAA